MVRRKVWGEVSKELTVRIGYIVSQNINTRTYSLSSQDDFHPVFSAFDFEKHRSISAFQPASSFLFHLREELKSVQFFQGFASS